MVKLTKLRGATLVETLIAMILLLIISALSFTVILNVMRDGNTHQMIEARIVSNELAYTTVKEKRFLDEDFSIQMFRVKKKIINWQEDPGLKVLMILVYNSDGRLLDKRNEIISVE